MSGSRWPWCCENQVYLKDQWKMRRAFCVCALLIVVICLLCWFHFFSCALHKLIWSTTMSDFSYQQVVLQIQHTHMADKPLAKSNLNSVCSKALSLLQYEQVLVKSITIPQWMSLVQAHLNINTPHFHKNWMNSCYCMYQCTIRISPSQCLSIFPPGLIRLFPSHSALWLIGKFNQRNKWRGETLTFKR